MPALDRCFPGETQEALPAEHDSCTPKRVVMHHQSFYPDASAAVLSLTTHAVLLPHTPLLDQGRQCRQRQPPGGAMEVRLQL